LGGYVAGLIGFILIILSYSILVFLFYIPRAGTSPPVIAFLFAVWTIHLAFFALWIRGRRWISYQSWGGRWGLALAVWLLIPLHSVVLFIVIALYD
jgi:hypothetical protein